MITNEQISKYLSSLRPHTVTSERATQKWHVPYIITNTIDDAYLATYDEIHGIEAHIQGSNEVIKNIDAEFTGELNYLPSKLGRQILLNDPNDRDTHPEKKRNIWVRDSYRFNGKWFSHRVSADKAEETFGILEVDNLPYASFVKRINKKSFIGRLDRLVFQGYIEPLMIFIDHRFVKWDDINIVYDCDESWILLSGEKYAYKNLVDKEINIVIMPFKCDYTGNEDNYLFELNYQALVNYLQETSIVENNEELYIQIPTLETEWEYNHMMFNVGGWMYTQIKKNYLGLLSEERINKLRYIPVYKYITNTLGDVTQTKYTRFNALDRDSYTSRHIYESMCYMPMESYYNYPRFRFNEDGVIDFMYGSSNFWVVDENTIVKRFESFEDTIYCDMSEIDNVLFRENYLIFVNTIFQAEQPIMSSINNITLCDNPEHNRYCIFAIYNKESAHVIRNSDAFLQSYMNEKAMTYLEVLYYSSYDPWTGVDAHILESERIIKNIDAYILDTEVAYTPTLTDYIVYLDDQNNDAVEVIKRSMDPLDFEIRTDKLYEDNINDALDKVIEYNPLLLNPLYHTYIDSKLFTGKQANESLIYDFMYERKRGLKIPRKKYKDHETYMMLFLNGELYEDYYKTICYANFFFIPVDDNFEFEADDRVEVLYFKNINNNEIRFRLSERLLNTLEKHEQDPNFYKFDIFKPFIHPEELVIFAHYPEKMLKYPTLISEPTEDIAFNISYRDDDGNLCIAKAGIQHLIDEINNSFEGVDGLDLEDMQTIYENILIQDMDTNEYYDYIRNNIYLNEIGYNLYIGNGTVYKELVACSKQKFIYQRLYVDQKAYRIAIDRRFRYCDNQRQYLLFINGRRMKQDSFLITIPKHTRPFSGMFLYTARFVTPEDRVELFYLPYEMTDLNIDNNPRKELKESGYFDYDRTDIDVPLSRDLYLFFINGKKIPADDIVDIDSHTVRVIVNTNTLKYPAITSIATDNLPKVTNYLHDEYKLSKYDSLIHYIKNRMHNGGYDELDKAFGYYTKMTDGEEDKTWANVAHIAILNEIVRDWWVTSGYPYQDQLFIYDYEHDELYEQMEDGTLILPALDANPEINIEKNEVSLLYFYTDPADLLFEIGSECHGFTFYWDYSQRLNQDLMILSQSINGISIPVDDREYEWVEDISTTKNFRFEANTGQQYLIKDATLDFVNGIYWGTLDEDQLQYYNMRRNLVWLNDIIALIPKDGKIKSSKQHNIESGNIELVGQIKDQNWVVRGLTYDEETAVIVNPWDDIPSYLQNIYLDNGIFAILEDGTVWDNIYATIKYEHYIDNVNVINIGAENIDAILEDESIIKNVFNIGHPFDQLQYYDAINHVNKINASTGEIDAYCTDGRIIRDVFNIHHIFDQLVYYDAIHHIHNTVTVYDPDFYAILEDGTEWKQPLFYQTVDHVDDNHELHSDWDDEHGARWRGNNYETILKPKMNVLREYYDQYDLFQMLPHLDKHLLRTADIKLEDYIIGNNKYFVFACPKRLVYNGSKENTVEFYFPELDSEEILSNCRDDKTTPVYTDGHFEHETKSLKKLYKITMEPMGEFQYTNDYGYTEPYLMWKTNGFFTRLFENYGFDIHIKIGDFDKVDYGFDNSTKINTITYENNNLLGNIVHAYNAKPRSVDSMAITEDGTAEGDYSTMLNAMNNKETTNAETPKVLGDKSTTDKSNDNNDTSVTSDGTNIEIMGSTKASDKRIRELLDQGIFLL